MPNATASSNPIGKGWTPADIPDQTGRRALITGANSGIGFHAALELARHGAHVLLACRSKPRGDAALARLRTELPTASAEVVELDLASLAHVRSFAEAQLAQGPPLDLLINNAGVMAPPKRRETCEGFEIQFATNVLGHFALTALLLPALERSARAGREKARVVTIASLAHKRGTVRLDDLQSNTAYNPMASYSQSKLANLLLAFEMERRFQAAHLDILSVAAHPGIAETNLFQGGVYNPIERIMRRAVGSLIGLALNSTSQGAIPTLFAATSPQAEPGGYYGPQGLAEARGGDVGPAQVASQASDAAAASRLWQACERLTGIPFLSSAS